MAAFMPIGDSVRLNCVMYEEIHSSFEILNNADVVVVCLNFEELISKFDSSCFRIRLQD